MVNLKMALFDSKTEAHHQYMYAIRRYKQREVQLRNDGMTDANCDIKSRNFFKEMKKLNPKVRVAPCVDGHVEYKDIADYLTKKYDDLYNSVPSDEQLMSKAKDYINSHSG